MRSPRVLAIVVLAIGLGALGTAYGSDVHVGSSSDPSRSSPAGAIYAIPLDNGRQDGSPTGDHGGQGISSIHSENGYGSSTVVPGVLASSASAGATSAASQSGHGGGHRHGSGKAAGATGGGPGGGGTGAAGGFGTGGRATPSALAAASTGHGPPSLPTFGLIVLIGGVAGVIGVTASRALRG